MGSTVSAIGLSVLSSALTLFLVLVGRLLWKHWLENVWLKITVRHIVDISGEWTREEVDEDVTVRETLSIKQYGWRVLGHVDYVGGVTNGGTESRKRFKFEGIFRSEIVSLYYWNMNRSCKGSGAIAVRLVGDGDSLVGFEVVYDVESADVKQRAVTYTRSRS